MSIESYIQKKKRQKEAENLDVNQFISGFIENITQELWNELKPKLIKEAQQIIQSVVDNLVKNVRKGDNGADGQDGEDGYTPIKGVDYFDGKDGKDADEEKIISKVIKQIPKPKDGKDGKDGSPDKPQQIADKLNTLKEKINISVIKDLNNEIDAIYKHLNSIKSSKLGGGGGMSEPQHEAHTLTSATTSVDLSYNVAANGLAIWVYYQGQAVSRNDASGYSILGKTITLNFTPQDNTYLDVIYFRK